MVVWDKSIGNVLHTVNTAWFVYFSLWVLVSPFVDSNHFTQRIFPPREYALLIPALIVSIALTICVTVASVLVITAKGSASTQAIVSGAGLSQEELHALSREGCDSPRGPMSASSVSSGATS